MLNKQITSLTQNGLSKLINAKDIANIIVQVIEFNGCKKKTSNEDFFISSISDGKFKIKCFWSAQCTALIQKTGNNFENQIIKIVKYVASLKHILVYKYETIFQAYSQIIGKPVLFQKALSQISNKQQKQSNISIVIDITKIKKIDKKIQINNTTNSKFNKSHKQQHHQKTIKKRLDIKNQAEFQQISDLYPSLDNWRLYCRLIKKNYSQFVNKKKEITKILELELMDKKSNLIKATIFGEFGQKMNQQLQENQVYTISQGLIKLDTYTKKKNQNLSPYTIVLTERSKIFLTIDDKSIKNNHKIEYNLINDIKNKQAGEEVDVLAIIKQIQDEMIVNPKSIRDSSVLKKRTVIICDPIQKIEIDAVFWNNLTNINLNFLHKTVLLSSFKIHEYNQTKSLNSNFKSKISPILDHKFNAFEKQIQYIQCQSLSYKKSSTQNNPKNIKEMEEIKETIKQNGQIWSYFRVYLNRIRQKAPKKWYLGCPFCKKTVQETDTSCISCKKTFEKAKNRYILQIQLSDDTGSFWTTAYDQFSERIFKHLGDYPADVAIALNQNQFETLAKKSYFQEFKMLVISKYERSTDGVNRLRHNVAKLLPMTYANEAKNNLQQIKKLI